MIRPLRRTHAALLPALAVLTAILLGLALERRPAEPLNDTWPAALAPGRVEGARP